MTYEYLKDTSVTSDMFISAKIIFIDRSPSQIRFRVKPSGPRPVYYQSLVAEDLGVDVITS